jgi:hypothetical protein
LAKVEQDLAATGGNFTSEAYAVWTDSLKCLNNPPPVGGALYSNVMGAIGAAAMFGGGASGGQMGDQTGTALADASKSLSHAVTLLRDAPPADTWAPGLAKALGG